MVICSEYIHNYQIQKALNRIAGVMVSVLTSSVVGCGTN